MNMDDLNADNDFDVFVPVVPLVDQHPEVFDFYEEAKGG